MIGPLLGLAGYELFHHRIGPVLYLAVIPAVLSVLLIAWVRERPPDAPRAAPSSMLAGARRLPRRYWQVVAFLVMFSIANFPDALLLLRLKQIGFSVVGVILAYVGYNVVYALASFPAGVLADRLGRSVVYGIGLAFFAFGYLGLGITTNMAAAWGLIVVYGLFTACYDGVREGLDLNACRGGAAVWRPGRLLGIRAGSRCWPRGYGPDSYGGPTGGCHC